MGGPVANREPNPIGRNEFLGPYAGGGKDTSSAMQELPTQSIVDREK